MPPRAPKFCGRRDCDEIISGRTYCEKHTPVGWKRGKSRTATPEHRRFRAAVLRRCGGMCEMRLVGCTGAATEADHIVPVAEGGAEFDVRNGRGACTKCHKVKTTEETRRGYERYTNRRRNEIEPPF